ncbi:MAG: hypothetical protein R3D59_14050 [Paracoccaceae bacterium]
MEMNLVALLLIGWAHDRAAGRGAPDRLTWNIMPVADPVGFGLSSRWSTQRVAGPPGRYPERNRQGERVQGREHGIPRDAPSSDARNRLTATAAVTKGNTTTASLRRDQRGAVAAAFRHARAEPFLGVLSTDLVPQDSDGGLDFVKPRRRVLCETT